MTLAHLAHAASPSASSTAAAVDVVATIVFSVAGLAVLGVFAAMIVLVLRNRRSAARPRGEAPRRERLIETSWTLATLVAFLAIFALGVRGYDAVLRAPAGPEAADAVDILVLGKRWMWEFQQPSGRREVETLHVPAGRVVRLHLRSADVIHSFYLPDFRIKRDVVPGQQQSLWFQAAAPGRYPLRCAEYCGTDHARMQATIVALAPAEYAAWLAQDAGDLTTLQAAGRALFERLDCVTCHEHGEPSAAPELAGLYGRPVTLEAGGTVIADDDYLQRSILQPGDQVVRGYPATVMPSYAGVLQGDDLALLLNYLRASDRAEEAPR